MALTLNRDCEGEQTKLRQTENKAIDDETQRGDILLPQISTKSDQSGILNTKDLEDET